MSTVTTGQGDTQLHRRDADRVAGARPRVRVGRSVAHPTTASGGQVARLWTTGRRGALPVLRASEDHRAVTDLLRSGGVPRCGRNRMAGRHRRAKHDDPEPRCGHHLGEDPHPTDATPGVKALRGSADVRSSLTRPATTPDTARPAPRRLRGARHCPLTASAAGNQPAPIRTTPASAPATPAVWMRPSRSCRRTRAMSTVTTG